MLDEFNKIVAHSDLSTVALSQLTEVRHRKTWTFVSGQLPDQFPPEMSNLSSGSICGQTEGAASYEALCAMRPTLRKISRETFAKLRKGEVVVCFRDASDEKYRGEPLLVKIRPACAQPGGQTRCNSTEAEGED